MKRKGAEATYSILNSLFLHTIVWSHLVINRFLVPKFASALYKKFPNKSLNSAHYNVCVGGCDWRIRSGIMVQRKSRWSAIRGLTRILIVVSRSVETQQGSIENGLRVIKMIKNFAIVSGNLIRISKSMYIYTRSCYIII